MNIASENILKRRNFLRGIGACVALPAFESISAAVQTSAKAVTKTGAPLRMAYLYIPNGVNLKYWTPIGTGTDYKLNRTMEPLAPFKQHFQVYSDLEHKHGWAGPDGAGDHARANATILTGVRPRKTAGADIRLGISVDQVAANAIGDETRFASLELSTDGARKSGGCDSGYSCAYQFNLAWRSETTPMAPEHNPRLVFERLFGAGNGEERKRNYQSRVAQKRSILDFVLADARTLHGQLGLNDQQKLDEYLTGVREIERRIQKTEHFGAISDIKMKTPAGIPSNHQEHIRLMIDLMVLAFRTDSTRVCTFSFAHDGSNRNFRDIGVSEGHHSLSHHRDNEDWLRKIAKIDRFYAEQFAYYLAQMSSAKDSDGKSLLENSMTVYASGLSDGNRHSHNKLPVIVAGHGGGELTPGRHVSLGRDTPMTNLYVTMLNKMGVNATSFGDSTGPLKDV